MFLPQRHARTCRCSFFLAIFIKKNGEKTKKLLTKTHFRAILSFACEVAHRIFHMRVWRNLSDTPRVRAQAKQSRAVELMHASASESKADAASRTAPRREGKVGCKNFICGFGGIGRRVRFRFLWSQGCEGSSPLTRTKAFKPEPFTNW